jgi:GNAT superfamily N-acetyltransferase
MIAYRHAALEEAPDILAAIKAIADEIPLRLEKLEHEEALYRTIRNCARSGESWVAVDSSGHIVGFLLAEPNQTDRFWGENEAIDLRYAGVLPEFRRQGLFGELLNHLLARLVPVTVHVATANNSGIGRRFEAAGFTREAAPGGQRYRHQI